MKSTKKNKHITKENTHNGLNINTKNQTRPCYTEVIDKHHTHLDDMLEKHNRVMQTRFDLRYPTNDSVIPRRQHVHDFSYNLQRKFNREVCQGGHKVDPRILLVTEQNKSKNPHIHGVILVNANAKQKYIEILEEVKRQWKQALHTENDGLVNYCNEKDKNGIIIYRDSVDYGKIKNELSHQASYLAKTRDKDKNQKGTWLVSGTRLPKSK